jgi:hypothetical protein
LFSSASSEGAVKRKLSVCGLLINPGKGLTLVILTLLGANFCALMLVLGIVRDGSLEYIINIVSTPFLLGLVSIYTILNNKDLA